MSQENAIQDRYDAYDASIKQMCEESDANKTAFERVSKEYADLMLDRRKSTDTLDMMRDEFQRIKAICRGEKASCLFREIEGLCDRAVTRIWQTVPIIVQRDLLSKQLREATAANQEMGEALERIADHFKLRLNASDLAEAIETHH